MPLWLPEAAARIQPGAIDGLLVAAGLARSLTEARRLIGDGAIYWNNEKLVPPEPGFLPVIWDPRQPEAYEWIWDALREGGWISDGEVGADPGTGVHPGSAGTERAVEHAEQEGPSEAEPALLHRAHRPRPDA